MAGGGSGTLPKLSNQWIKWRVQSRDKKDRDRQRNESESPTAVRVWTYPTDTVGSAMAGMRHAVSWYGRCWTS